VVTRVSYPVAVKLTLTAAVANATLQDAVVGLYKLNPVVDP
jgi:hypothetical protein